MKLISVATADKETVGIVSIGQRDQASRDASFPETLCEVLRRLLAAAVGVGIKGYVDGSESVAQLLELMGIEMNRFGSSTGVLSEV